ncbi:cyclic peptide export ABC transporter [Roseibium sp.]|uniref:cyclic peptide export ABC transporter n=1 Tax=Roseibium sp. TaxID=1936156 RepID=UPI003A9850AE
MNILRLLRSGTSGNRQFIIIVTSLSGLGNAGLVGLINQAAERSLLDEAISVQLMIVYLLTLFFFIVSNRSSLLHANRFVQSRLETMRRRVVNKIGKVDLRTLERMGQGDVYLTVAQETDHLSQTLPLIIGAAQSAFLLVFLILYIATLSLISFFVVAGFTVLGILFFLNRQKALTGYLGEVHYKEAELIDNLSHFTLGFQEIRLNANKNDALFEHFTNLTSDLKDAVLRDGGRWVTLLQFSNAFVFLLAGLVVFVLPIFFGGYTDTIYKIMAVSVFAVGPMAALTSVIRLLGRAEVGLGHVYDLERRLDEGLSPPGPKSPRQNSPFRDFSKIELSEAMFRYVDRENAITFAAGPLNLTLNRGEIVFMTGGNGSGKSTALKLLCGLYLPESGRVLCDGEEVTDITRQQYREIYSAIFTDFHLFDRPYGMENVSTEEVERLIAKMELSDKVRFEKGRFTTRELSTGQRKRLAMISCLLEDREVYIFDEWAADQDSHFRDVFYREMLPDFKARGKTVIAVTHDDKYWDCCDRQVTLDLGMITMAGVN